MSGKHLVVLGALALAGCSGGEVPSGNTATGGQTADARATLVSLNVPGMT